ncbi:endonuclease [Chryseobacterium caseinilyticum]|uniref:Endonuclease n=1 Tax=Chryseobacterium caseinilyticum TaxID=2771428 RepID=A0ABR8ZFS5_9FLAO|nr:endonuclease [Chryseobacterium caseinilyticum]MBD8084152.1 endonuclease [Chryseobacterium caseinilyticum]
MKRFLSFLAFSFAVIISNAQAPAGYYDNAAGLTGANLKTALKTIITANHNPGSYGGLWTAYQTTDRDNAPGVAGLENDNSILDIYSENPNGPDPYNYFSTASQCGNYNGEGDCYNREHIVPQSLFNEASPMVSDIHFIRATDGSVNNARGSLPFGVVGVTNYISQNGSKRGNSVSPGFTGTVFEPIDAFKGDVARMIFYFVTRYETQLSGFSSGNMLGNSAYPGLQTWELNQLLAWHNADPVSQNEVIRNNASYTYQGNRNPFIDNPSYANAIWGTQSVDTQAPTTPTNLVVTGTTPNSVSLSWTASTDNVGVTGYNIYVNGTLHSTVTGTTATVSGLASGTTYSFYVVAKDASNNLSPQSNSVQGTTTTDTQAPTAPANLAVTGTSNNSVSLSWTASTDNVGVTGYNIYLNGTFHSTVTGTSATVSGLNPSTTYSFYVVAADAANNLSAQSNTAQGTTTATPPAGTNCGTEDFSTIPANANNYTTRTWTNNGITWTATDARTDQTINGRAIVIRTGSLTSSTITNGIQSITLTTQLPFTDNGGTLTVRVNGNIVGTAPYSTTVQTTTISNINVSGNAVLSITNSNNQRVGIDDLSWTCGTLSTKDLTVEKAQYQLYPNPVKNHQIFIKGEKLDMIKTAEIYNLNGQLLKKIEKPFIHSNKIEVRELTKGIYILKTDEFSTKFIID